jgi:hypothetical protein
MARRQRPDFSDAGYVQMGCPVMLVSVVVGVPIALFVAWWLDAEPAAVPVEIDAGYLLTVIVAALTGALAITLAAMWVIDRIPTLWVARMWSCSSFGSRLPLGSLSPSC